MGRGNCCVFGKYEGLYFIDSDDIHVYCRASRDTGEPPELRLLRDLNFSSLSDGTWIYHEMATCVEEEDILSCFMEDFLQMFLSFRRVAPEQWISRSQRVILENALFYIRKWGDGTFTFYPFQAGIPFYFERSPENFDVGNEVTEPPAQSKPTAAGTVPPGDFEECESRDCAYNRDGTCRFSLVFDRQPKIIEEDGCTEFVTRSSYSMME